MKVLSHQRGIHTWDQDQTHLDQKPEGLGCICLPQKAFIRGGRWSRLYSLKATPMMATLAKVLPLATCRGILVAPLWAPILSDSAAHALCDQNRRTLPETARALHKITIPDDHGSRSGWLHGTFAHCAKGLRLSISRNRLITSTGTLIPIDIQAQLQRRR